MATRSPTPSSPESSPSSPESSPTPEPQWVWCEDNRPGTIWVGSLSEYTLWQEQSDSGISLLNQYASSLEEAQALAARWTASPRTITEWDARLTCPA